MINFRAINIYTYSNTKRLLEHNLPTASLTSITFASGILAGVVTSTATNPIWVVKTRLQLDKSITGARRYQDSLDCLGQIWRKEGLRGFSRGLSASYLGVSESTLQWVMYERLKRVFRTEKKVPTTFREKLGQALGAGFFAKLIATVVTYPHEVPSPWKYLSDRFLGCEDTITAGSIDGRGSKEEI
jgi:solute carrier family 25, member 33/36